MSMPDMMELEDAIKLLKNNITPQMRVQSVPLEQALGCHSSADIFAPSDVPAFNRAGVDGYAVKAESIKGATRSKPVILRVLEELMAGDFSHSELDASQCVRIMTGAPVPDGFDAVIKQEDTNMSDENVEIYASVEPGANYGKIGEDIQKGACIIPRFTKLAPIHLGILASLGMPEVEILQPPVIGLISSGSELRELGTPLAPGQIYCSNRHVLSAKLKEMGVNVAFSIQNRDDVSEFVELIDKLIDKVDMVITTGAVSVGKMDIMHEVIERLGAKQLFWKVNMRPGTPVLASIYRNKPILSLSGNPLAAVTTFDLLFRPMLCTFLYTEAYALKHTKAILMDDFNKESNQRRFVSARLEENRVYLGAGDTSSVLSGMLDCNCYIDIKAGTSKIEKGQEVEVLLI